MAVESNSWQEGPEQDKMHSREGAKKCPSEMQMSQQGPQPKKTYKAGDKVCWGGKGPTSLWIPKDWGPKRTKRPECKLWLVTLWLWLCPGPSPDWSISASFPSWANKFFQSWPLSRDMSLAKAVLWESGQHPVQIYSLLVQIRNQFQGLTPSFHSFNKYLLSTYYGL